MSETQERIRAVLGSSDASEKARLLSLFWALASSVDLYPYLNLIEALGEGSADRERVSHLADDIELRHAPRQRRIELLSAAIRTGVGTSPRGQPLYRFVAMYLAARGGLDEFRPAVEEYMTSIEPERLRARRQHTIPALFELCGGSESWTDCPRAALQRVLETQEGALEERFSSDSPFREVFLNLVRDAYGGFGGKDHQSETWALAKRLLDRQLRYRASQPGIYRIPEFPAPSCTTPLANDWLEDLVNAAPNLRPTSPWNRF